MTKKPRKKVSVLKSSVHPIVAAMVLAIATPLVTVGAVGLSDMIGPLTNGATVVALVRPVNDPDGKQLFDKNQFIQNRRIRNTLAEQRNSGDSASSAGSQGALNPCDATHGAADENGAAVVAPELKVGDLDSRHLAILRRYMRLGGCPQSSDDMAFQRLCERQLVLQKKINPDLRRGPTNESFQSPDDSQE